MIRLDLGAGDVSPAGFTPMGHAHGSAVFPLPYADGTVDEIRASHVLEHFPHGQIAAVLADWVRALKPGGRLRVAVPDFAQIAERYIAGDRQPVIGLVMGGQQDEHDFHRALFDERELKGALAKAGLVLIRPWRSELADAAALPVSLNIEGTKPYQAGLSVSVVVSLPRLAWTDNAMGWVEGIVAPFGFPVRHVRGAYWGQCLERGIMKAIAEDKPDAILTLDYDTIFTRAHVKTLISLMLTHPEADAIFPVQEGRGTDLPLFTASGADGRIVGQVPRAVFEADLWGGTPGDGGPPTPRTAHFGLTLFRADRFARMPHPWFHDVPAPDGTWGEGKRDADIDFWRKWQEAGNSLHLANRVVVGHLDAIIAWPGADGRPVYQKVSDWREKGPPAGIWQ